ncbi:MAG: FMN-binding glutamate synthase family protein [Planctomycetes bacterium]|jgi:glutamate synthase domain-containing protein 2|nr:FMN-binding glutamate synthase family protein [Planctomycetota bacterium]
MRFLPLFSVLVLAALCVVLGMKVRIDFLWGLVLLGPLALLGLWDMVQVRHSICRNYPIVAHLRFLFEAIRPEVHQYFVESDIDGRPFSRNQRSLIYERSKNIEGLKPFGTELDVYGEEYEWLNHSMAPRPKSQEHFRTSVGGPDCKQPYSCSLLNISAMSFGALSPNALMALNRGAKKGNFYHCTGEGGLSPHHLKYGGDLVWQVGTGYFGCRTIDGKFDPDLFRDQASHESVKMIEVKISQGAKPGHGGVLPASKISHEIAATRKVPMGQDCISPPGHSAFNSPRGLCEYIAQLRDLSGGKPIGFKLCIGHPVEFLSTCKAMIETGILPDFITVDGAEGGTGAAPPEFSDSIGAPLKGGLMFVHNALVGCDLRDRIKIAASGKVASAFGIARNLAIGADWCNAARGFMMAVGCIQAQTCHTNECPVGVATQNARRQRALNVADKAERTYHFHHSTMETLCEIVAAAGLDDPAQLQASNVYLRTSRVLAQSYDEAFHFLKRGALLAEDDAKPIHRLWDMASANAFQGTV